MFELEFLDETRYATTKEEVFREIDDYVSKLPENTYNVLFITNLNNKKENMQTIVGGEYSQVITLNDKGGFEWIEKEGDYYTPELLEFRASGDGAEMGTPYIISWEKAVEYIHSFLDRNGAQ